MNDFLEEELEILPDNIKLDLKKDDLLFSELNNDDILDGIDFKKFNEAIAINKDLR